MYFIMWMLEQTLWIAFLIRIVLLSDKFPNLCRYPLIVCRTWGKFGLLLSPESSSEGLKGINMTHSPL